MFVWRRNSLFFQLISVLFLPLSLLYLLAITFKKLFAVPLKYPSPIISIGNITAGGTGKTPLVVYLAEKFQLRRRRVVVLSSAAGICQKRNSAIKRDDEICMLMEKFPGITVGTKKKEKPEGPERPVKPEKDIILIDDGFQSYEIKRDLDILTVDASNPFDNNFLLPAGLLREPVSCMKRADVLIITHPYMVSESALDRLAERLKRMGKPVYVMDYEIKSLNGKGEKLPPAIIENKEVIGVAGVGNPLNFFSLMLRLKPGKIHAMIYPDHFSYTGPDAGEIRLQYLEKKVHCLITTEKDYVKLKNFFHGENVPLFYLEIEGRMKNFYEKYDFDTFLDSVIK